MLKSSQLESNKNLCIEPFNDVKNIDLEPFIRDYYTQQQYSLSINMNEPNYKQLTEIVDMFEMDLTKLDITECQHSGFEVRPIESGRADFVLYWFEMISAPNDLCYSPVQNGNLNDPNTFWNQLVAFSVTSKQREINLDKHDMITIDYMFKNQMLFVRDLITKTTE